MPGKIKDMTGQRFGKLVAIKLASRRREHTRWLFQCDCGNTKEISRNNVMQNLTKSCGCLRRGRPHKSNGPTQSN